MRRAVGTTLFDRDILEKREMYVYLITCNLISSILKKKKKKKKKNHEKLNLVIIFLLQILNGELI